MSKRKVKQAATKASIAQKNHLELRDIQPLTNTQRDVFDAYDTGRNLFLHGFPGTGKSFLSLFLALDEIEETGLYDQVLVIRSIVSSRDPGFLPGTIKDKQAVYEEPFIEILNEMYGRGDAARLLREKGLYDFTTTSYLRGHTLRNKIIIVDECQNMTFQELDTVMTRVGEGSKIIFCGDFRQKDFDLQLHRDRAGLLKFINITKAMKCFEYIEFYEADIVRSGTVKDYIIAKIKLENVT